MGKMGGNHTLLNHCFQHLYGDLNAKLVEVVLLLGNVLATMMMKIGGIGRYEFPLPAFFLLTGARAGPQLLQFVQNNLHYVHFAMVHRALHTAKHIVHTNEKWGREVTGVLQLVHSFKKSNVKIALLGQRVSSKDLPSTRPDQAAL